MPKFSYTYTYNFDSDNDDSDSDSDYETPPEEKESDDEETCKPTKQKSKPKNTKDLLNEYLTEMDKQKEKYAKKYSDIVKFLSKIKIYFNPCLANFSQGTLTDDRTKSEYKYTVINYSHLPASIILDEKFTKSVRTTLNRDKSDEHTERLKNLNYHLSILDSCPFVFAIMKKELGKDIIKEYSRDEIINEPEINLNDTYAIYSLDGQHRMSVLYDLKDKSILDKKYVDIKFYMINTIDEYYTAFIALNSNLPQREGFIKHLEERNKLFMALVDKINDYTKTNYFKNTNKKPTKLIIRQDTNTESPQPPCIHINQLKKSNKFSRLLEKMGVDNLFDRMIEVNQLYKNKTLQELGYGHKKKTHPYRIKADLYEFYLGLYNENPIKFIDDL